MACAGNRRLSAYRRHQPEQSESYKFPFHLCFLMVWVANMCASAALSPSSSGFTISQIGGIMDDVRIAAKDNLHPNVQRRQSAGCWSIAPIISARRKLWMPALRKFSPAEIGGGAERQSDAGHDQIKSQTGVRLPSIFGSSEYAS
jgi:hypothetical protein